MSKIYQTTDELWEAVINNLPEEIKANVSAFAGKAYIHIKPKSKHLGIKDFKYCVEYSKTKERAYVNVETLNGGVEGKTTIQNYIDSNNADCIVKSVVPQQGVKNMDKWKWEVTTPAAELNEELALWYVQTIVAFWNFFEGESEVGVNADDTPKTKQVRLAIFAAQQPKLISLQTLCEDDMEVVDENGASVETYEHLVDHGSGEWVNLAFVPSGCCVELNVTDPNADDDDDDAYRLYSDDEFEVCPNYGMMNMQEAKENYEDDSASIERYTAYLNIEMGEDYDRLTNKGLKVTWERLKTNEVNAESYVPAVMQYVMSEEGGDKAFLRGLQVEDITMVFNIDIPEGEEFDPSKLDFINMDAEYEDNSEVLSELLAADMLLLNAIIYDGKMYFADGYEDVTEDSWGDAEYYYDIVDADEAAANNIDKVESEVEENAENSSGKERLTLKQYILNLVYIFDEFDMDDCDGSYYTKFGKLGEFDLFDEEQIDDVLSDNYIYDGELSKDSFCDEVSEDDLYCVISNLVDNLDQGSIKSMQIKDGSKVIFEVSNDEPFVD